MNYNLRQFSDFTMALGNSVYKGTEVWENNKVLYIMPSEISGKESLEAFQCAKKKFKP